jgi:hypothetical protein
MTRIATSDTSTMPMVMTRAVVMLATIAPGFYGVDFGSAHGGRDRAAKLRSGTRQHRTAPRC